MITLWHNPRCSNSRTALKLLEERGTPVTVRKYLEDQPSRAELDHVAHKLGLPPSAFIRTGEKLYKSLGLDQVDDENTLLDAMAENPILIERPIAIHHDKAAIGRPPEAVLGVIC